MRVVSPSLVLLCLNIVNVNASNYSEPLVSVSRAASLARDSFKLVGSLVAFSSEKLDESLGDSPPGKIYREFLNHVYRYRQMLIDWSETSAFAAAVNTAATFIGSQISHNYERVNALSARIIDPLVNNFESRFPSVRGFIGRSLIDRLFLAGWLVWLTKASMYLVQTVLTGPRSRKMF